MAAPGVKYAVSGCILLKVRELCVGCVMGGARLTTYTHSGNVSETMKDKEVVTFDR